MGQKAFFLIFVAALSVRWAAAQEMMDTEIPWVPPDEQPAPTLTPAPLPSPVSVQSSTTLQKPAEGSPSATPTNDMKALKAKEDPWRRPLEKLTPEQRQRFKENLERWNKLSKEQQDELRRNEKLRKERLLNEINDAIKKSGLKLDANQRQIFTARYDQERRTIEEKLREELDAKRRLAVADLIRHLIAEVQQPTLDSVPVLAAPANASPTPK